MDDKDPFSLLSAQLTFTRHEAPLLHYSGSSVPRMLLDGSKLHSIQTELLLYCLHLCSCAIKQGENIDTDGKGFGLQSGPSVRLSQFVTIPIKFYREI